MIFVYMSPQSHRIVLMFGVAFTSLDVLITFHLLLTVLHFQLYVSFPKIQKIIRVSPLYFSWILISGF